MRQTIYLFIIYEYIQNSAYNNKYLEDCAYHEVNISFD